MYDIIVADPPWHFKSNSKQRPGRNAMRHYACMELADIKALRPDAAPNALLYLWVTSPFLAEGMDVLSEWGFTYKSSLVWVKDRIGTGYWARNRHELVLIGRRGKFPLPPACPHADSVLSGGQREHSRKPEALQDQIDAAWPAARKLEMFARRPRLGWDVWGNETEKFAA